MASIWMKYSVTSTHCRQELICNVNKTIQMILDLSEEQVDNDMYAEMYMAILESQTKSHHSQKSATQPKHTPEPSLVPIEEPDMINSPIRLSEEHSDDQDGICNPTRSQDSIAKDLVGNTDTLHLLLRNNMWMSRL